MFTTFQNLTPSSNTTQTLSTALPSAQSHPVYLYPSTSYTTVITFDASTTDIGDLFPMDQEMANSESARIPTPQARLTDHDTPLQAIVSAYHIAINPNTTQSHKAWAFTQIFKKFGRL